MTGPMFGEHPEDEVALFMSNCQEVRYRGYERVRRTPFALDQTTGRYFNLREIAFPPVTGLFDGAEYILVPGSGVARLGQIVSFSYGPTSPSLALGCSLRFPPGAFTIEPDVMEKIRAVPDPCAALRNKENAWRCI